jgi:hypothetical protein
MALMNRIIGLWNVAKDLYVYIRITCMPTGKTGRSNKLDELDLISYYG